MLKLKDLKVKDVMTPTPRTIPAGTTVREALRFFSETHFAGAPVVGPNGEVAGGVGVR